MTNNKKKQKDLFFIHQEKIVAILVLCLFVWMLFGSFVLFENIDNSLAKVEPQFAYSVDKVDNLAKPTVVIQSYQITTSSYPVAVMIDNNSSARPQSGLTAADFIYEAPVEGGATRLMAVYNLFAKDTEIGPVRSARPYFVEWASEFKSLYVHAGGSPDALALINRSPVTDLNEISGYGQYYFYRKNQKSAPHNLYTNTNQLSLALEDFSLSEKQEGVYDNFIYTAQLDNVSTSSTTKVSIDISEGSIYDAKFVFSPSDNFYNRYENNQIKIDQESQLPINISNIIIQLIPPEIVLDNAGRLSLAIIGQGNGYLLQAGQLRNITWQKNSEFSLTQYINDGEKIKLLPGLTWVLVVPTNREIIFQ